MNVVAKAYWRRIKAGTRTFENVPASVKDDVRTLAQADVAAGEITAEAYRSYIGEEYHTEVE